MAKTAKAVAEVHLSPAQKAWATMRARGGKFAPKPQKPRPKMEPHTKIKLPKEAPMVDSKDMVLRTQVFVLTFSAIGNRRKTGEQIFQVVSDAESAKKNPFNTTKELMEAPELDEITSLCGETRRFVETRALPFHIKRGIYLLPNAFDKEVHDRLAEARTKLEPLVEQLAKNLPKYKAEAKVRLSKVQVGDEIKNFFDEEDYPTAAEIRAAFAIKSRSLKVDSADGLSKERDAEERAKSQADWAETRDTIKLVLRTQLKEFVDHLVERLSPNEHGEKKSFRESGIEKFTDFLNTFDARNITNDAQMKILVDKAKNLVGKADTDLLRNDDVVRDYVRHGFETIQNVLDPMIAKSPRRNIKIVD